MKKEVSVVTDKVSKSVLREAKERFQDMQKSWFYFGKSIHAVYYGEHYKSVDPDMSFKEYCENEFSLNYGSIMKIVSIVEQYGEAIEARVKKDSAYKIPTYDDFYHVVLVENKPSIPREEISKLKKDVLDGKIFCKKLRKKFGELIKAHTKKTKEEVEKSAKELERGLIKDIEEDNLDEFDEESFIGDGEEDEVESDEIDDIDEDEDSDLKSAIASTQARVDYLNDNLRDLLKRIEADGPSDEAATLCEKMDKLNENINKFLDKYETINE